MKDSCISGPKYCASCGKELETYATICNSCGVDSSKRVSKKKKKKRSKKE